VSQLAKEGMRVELNKKGAVLRDYTGAIIAKGKMNDGLYILQEAAGV
jgi:hypothetical protein